MDLFNNISMSYEKSKKTIPELSNSISFSDVDFIQRKNVIRQIRRKTQSGKYGLDAKLLFDDIKLTPGRLKGIEKLIHTADEKKLITPELKAEIQSSFRDYNNWNKSIKKKSKHELRKKMRNKIISIEIALNLALSNPNSPLFDSYTNTVYFCQSLYEQDGYKIKSKYCNCRHCYSCNRIRTGKLMNNYMPFVEWMKDDMYFVTLTIPNVSKGELSHAIRQMKSTFVKIKDVMRKKKNGKMILTGLRKLECTHNHKKDTYHPHYHFLIKGYFEARMLYKYWLQYNPNADVKAQKLDIADMGSAKELFKYFTKFWSKKQNGTDEDKIIDYQAQDTIYNSIKGVRIFQPFGMKKFKEETNIEIDESEEIEPVITSTYNIQPDEENFYFNPETYNYMSTDGVELIDFKLNKKDKKLLIKLESSIIPGYKEKRQELTDPLKDLYEKNWWSDST